MKLCLIIKLNMHNLCRYLYNMEVMDKSYPISFLQVFNSINLIQKFNESRLHVVKFQLKVCNHEHLKNTFLKDTHDVFFHLFRTYLHTDYRYIFNLHCLVQLPVNR